MSDITAKARAQSIIENVVANEVNSPHLCQIFVTDQIRQAEADAAKAARRKVLEECLKIAERDWSASNIDARIRALIDKPEARDV